MARQVQAVGPGATEATDAIVWLLDAGAEHVLPVSLCSLRLSAAPLWAAHPKVILDIGLSASMRTWLDDQRGDGVHRVELPRPDASAIVGGRSHGPAEVMRARVTLTATLASLVTSGALPPLSSFLHVDPDTVFLDTPGPVFRRAWVGEHLRIAREWDWFPRDKPDRQVALTLDRPGTFRTTAPDRGTRLARHLGFDAGELQTLETYNSGVWAARPDSSLAGAWERSYERLCEIDAVEGGGFLNPHSSEQNALTIAIHQGDILCRPLRRSFNQFPPRPPHDWPDDTRIAHFITFARNSAEPRYGRWFQWRDAIVERGLCPASLVDVTRPEPGSPESPITRTHAGA